MNAARNDVSDEKFDELIASYRNLGDATLDNTVDDVLALRADGQLSNELAIRIIKFLIARQIAQDIRVGIAQTSSRRLASRSNKMQFLRVSYGRTEESFAI